MIRFRTDITREDFCEMIIKLYERLSNKRARTTVVNPFDDTDNEDILKAYSLGIVGGVSKTKFAPNTNITREQIAAMIYRTLEAAEPSLITGNHTLTFADKDAISPWAVDAVAFMNSKEIIGGVRNNKVDPKGNTTREQAIAMVVRTFEAFKISN